MLLVLHLRFLEGLVWARCVGDSKIRKCIEEAEWGKGYRTTQVRARGPVDLTDCERNPTRAALTGQWQVTNGPKQPQPLQWEGDIF